MRAGRWGALAAMAVCAWAATARASTGVEVDYGFADYNRSLSGVTDAGPAYGATLSFTALRFLGVELNYNGSQVDYVGFNDQKLGTISQNGGAALLRLNFLRGVVRPFAFGGVGASRLSMGTGVPLRTDTALDVPLGAGIGLDVTDHFEINGRFRYNLQYDADVAPPGAAGHSSFDRWMATLGLGVRL